ncbi:unnamed protein product [Phytomonas sp. EM1]|nr:unnamed protein product [Phytomonas sp. EM1]|eukprot:CCW62695.1 unnamed protein product [Phytomonas sp. isolate EM1]
MDKYQKVRVLGKGSFGSAILIKRKVDNALFVVKEVSFLKMSKKERDEARHECTILQKLKHPNIVRYVEQFENQRSLYIVMEYCDGGDLNAKIQQSRVPMKEPTIMYYFSQVCLAMEYLHSFHMLHRDIKTMNVFLMKNGAVKLGDFGITTILRNTMGMANTVCGTPYYFSPELCRNKPYNNKSDIWALGVLLYECATGGRHPFDGANMNQLMQRIVTGQCAAISSQYSPEFRKMIDWCLQKDPIRRPSIKQLLSLPLVRRSLEQLEENLMLATECRVRLKDIIDFNAGSPNSENSNECQAGKKTPCPTPRAEQKKVKQSPGLTPGQAAAMAVVQQSPTKGSPESKRVADILGPKPKVPNVNNNQNNANHVTPGEIYQRNMLDNLQQMRNRLNAAALAGPSPYAKRPSSPSNRKVVPPDSEPPVKLEEIAAVHDPPPFCEYQPNVQRIKAIMAKYEHNANPKAKETIHAYMRRKQEDYLKKQKEDLERRKRLNELREKELQRILVQQRRAALGVENNVYANGYNGNNKPIKEAQSPAPVPREAGVSPRNNRVPTAASPSPPSFPLNNDHRCAPAPHSPTRAGGLPLHTPAQGLQRMFGVDPRYAPCSPVKGVPKGNTPPLMANQNKVKVAANSPLHADKAAYQKAKQAVGKRKEGPSLGDQPRGFPKNRYSNGYPLDRLDHKAREVVSREAEERKNPKRRSFPTNAEPMKKNKNLVDKAASPQVVADDGMVIMGSQVPHFRSPQTRQGRPPRPAILNALLDNGNVAEHAAPRLTPPSTPISKPNAEKRVRSSLNLEFQPHVATPIAGIRNRIPSSPALTPRSLAALPPAVPHSALQSPEESAERLFKRIPPAAQTPKSYEVQASNLPLSPSKQNPLAAPNYETSNQLVSDSDVALMRLVENKTNFQDGKANVMLPLAMDTPPLELSSIVIKGNEDSISEAELIDVAHTVKGCTPVQPISLMNNKAANLSRQDSQSSNAAIPRKKAGLEDVKPIFHPAPDARPHHLCWPLSSDAARYAGMLKGPNIPAAEVELHPLKDVTGEGNEREVVVPSMLETLRTLRSKVSPYRDCNSADHFSKQLALLKQRQRLGVERHHVIKNTDILDTNSQSNEGPPEPIPEKLSPLHGTPRKNPILDSEDIFPSCCTSVESEAHASPHSDHDSVSDTKRTSLVEGYEEMLQHLRSLLEKRRVSYRNIRKLYKNAEDSVSRPSSPANLSKGDLDNPMSSNEIFCPSLDLVSGSPPRLLNTKSGKNTQVPVLVAMDELSESLHIDEATDDVNGDDDNFEDAIPLSPARCAMRNDMYTQMLQHNLIRSPEVNAKSSNASDILHSNGVPHGQDAILRRDCTRC